MAERGGEQAGDYNPLDHGQAAMIFLYQHRLSAVVISIVGAWFLAGVLP